MTPRYSAHTFENAPWSFQLNPLAWTAIPAKPVDQKTTSVWADLSFEGILMRGTAADNVLHGTWRNDRAFGLDGDDLIYMGSGQDTAFGGDGDDTIWGEDGNDWLYGQDGNDFLKGGGGNDVLNGGDGNDRIKAGLGDDTIAGGGGHDLIESDAGADVISGGSGFDTVSYAFSPTGVKVDLGTQENLWGYAEGDVLTGIEIIVGSNHDDTLVGSDAFEDIHGGAGDDIIYAGSGGARIYAGPNADDNDLLGDSLFGSIGQDQFYFEAGDSGASIGFDIINNLSDLDIMIIEGFGDVEFLGDQSWTSEHGAAASYYHTYYEETGPVTKVGVRDDFDAAADLVFLIEGHVDLTVNDFIFA